MTPPGTSFKKAARRPKRETMIDFRAEAAGNAPPGPLLLRGILAPWVEAGGALHRGSPRALLARLCGGKRSRGSLVVAAGATPSLVEAACARAGTGVTIVPSDRDGLPDPASLRLALERAGGNACCLVPVASPLGALAPPALLADVGRAAPGGLLLDLTFAPWEPALELAIPWPGTAALLGPERPFAAGAEEPWLAVETAPETPPPGPAPAPEGAETVLAWDEWIRSALEARDGIVTWPRARDTYAPGVIAFTLEGWAAAEAAAILEESFGILVDAGPPAVAPLPDAPGEVLRVFPSAEHREEEVEALVGALWRLAESRRPEPVAH